MARRQLQIVGTERTDIPPELDEAAEKWLGLRKEKRRTSEKAKESKFTVIALMQAHKIAKFEHTDPDTGEVIKLGVELEPKLSAKKSGEVESEMGEAIGDGPAMSNGSGPDVHEGLIAQAEKAQADAGVSETVDGDVVPPDTAAPKKPRAKKKASN